MMLDVKQERAKSLINSTKNGTEKDFAGQLLSTSQKSMISCKFYAKTSLFSGVDSCGSVTFQGAKCQPSKGH